MASISQDGKTGRRLIQFAGRDDTRKTVRLGKCNQRQAETAKLFIEDLIACSVSGGSPKGATSEWIAGLPVTMLRRLEKAGLIGPQARREVPTLGAWLESYVEGRADVKPATATVYGHTRRNLLTYFGADKRLDEITAGDADGFRVYLKTDEKLADNTVRRRMGIAKQFLRAAMRRKLIGENPFSGQSTVVRENPTRFYFVTQTEAEAVLAACPSPQWRLVFALCRWGGLRCPSEVAGLQWADVNWELMRLTVKAPKTQHHADAGIRVLPIFPELYPHLRDAFEEAEPGTVYCCPQFASPAQMYRKGVEKMLRAAGVEPWGKLFQNMRSTRETELVERFPIHAVCKWLGNSQPVAAKHYLQVTDEHFAKALQKALQSVSADARQDSPGPEAVTANTAIGGQSPTSAHTGLTQTLVPLGLTGLEPVTLRV